MEYPDTVKVLLKGEHERLDRSFSKIWGLLSPTKERDEIMWHIMSAKILLNKMIESNKEEPLK